MSHVRFVVPIGHLPNRGARDSERDIVLTTGGPRNEGPWKRWTPLKHGHSLVSMLDFWGVPPLLGCPAGSDRNDRDRKLVYFTYLRDCSNLLI